MSEESWSLTRSRRETIRSLRDRMERGPRLPDFLEAQASFPIEKDPPSFRPSSEPSFPFSDKALTQGKIVFAMNKVSLIALLFGLFLMGALLFLAGGITTYYFFPPKVSRLAATFPTSPKNQPATKEETSQTLDRVMETEREIMPPFRPGNVSPPPKQTPFQEVVKAVTPAAVQPLVDKVLGDLPQNPEFVEGARKTPSDTDAGRFTVQAKVYGDGAWAMQLARKFKEEGYGAYILKIKEKHTNRLHYHVRLGVFGDYMPANVLVRKLKEMGNRSASVVLVSRHEDRLLP